MALFVTLGWLASAVSLSKLIPTKSEAERLVEERNKSDDDEKVGNGDASKKRQ